MRCVAVDGEADDHAATCSRAASVQASARRDEHLDRVAPVGGRAAQVVDRPDVCRGERARRRSQRALVEVVPVELGQEAARRRVARSTVGPTEPSATRTSCACSSSWTQTLATAITIALARPDLGERAGAVDGLPFGRDDELVGGEGRLLRAEEELAPRDAAVVPCRARATTIVAS